MNSPQEITRACGLNPDFDGGNAYQRTKICCAALAEAGMPIPSWSVIRELYIGRGGANDINRGIKDFRVEQGERLRRMTSLGEKAGEIPERLVPLVQQLWSAATEEGEKLFDAKAADLRNRAQQAEAACEAAQTAQVRAEQQALERVHVLEVALATAEATMEARTIQIADVTARLQAEQATGARAEALYQANVADLGWQRDALQSAVERATGEVAKAMEALEGERRYALRSIEEARAAARAQATSDVEAVRRQAAVDIEVLKTDKQSLEAALARSQAAGEKSRTREAVLEQQLSDLRRELATLRAEGAGGADGAATLPQQARQAKPLRGSRPVSGILRRKLR